MCDINTNITTTPRTKDEPISNRRARREQFKRTIAIVTELFPAAFVTDKSKPHRPLKMGIGQDLVARGVLQPKECQALSSYVARRMYQAALAAGGPRLDLDGNIAVEVTPDHVEHAADAVARIEGRATAKAEAARKQKAARKVAKEMSAEQQPASRIPPPPPPPAPPPRSPSYSTAPGRDGIAALRRAALAKKEGRS
jgi:ProP effector